MYLFIDSSNIGKTKELLFEFEDKIFKEAFPDENERESFADDIIPRIEDADNKELQTFCVLSIGDDKAILGGLVADWYPECDSLELIYITVDKNNRQHNVGSKLLKNGINLIQKHLKSNDKEIKHIYLEVDIPTLSSSNKTEQTSSLKEAMNPVDRLAVWEKWGAKRIPINYVQPPLSEDKGPVCSMMLMYLTGYSDVSDQISAKDLKLFLKAFYKGLNASDDENLTKMLEGIDMIADKGNIKLESITEVPYAIIGDATITTHFQISGECKVKLPETCNDFNSFECDLMNYMNQNERPFKTKLVKLYKNVPLIMPSFFCYTSEGITHYFRTLPREELTVDVSISLSCPADIKKINPIAHLSIKPSSGLFSDYDFIRIATGFGSRQEGYKADRDIKFLIEDKYYTFKEILQSTLGLDSSSQVIETHEGVSQLDIKKIKPFNRKKTFPKTKFFSSFAPDANVTVNALNKVVCGLVLGIFDHDRMNSAEVEDTIRPLVYCSDSFIVINRGHIFKIEELSEEDRKSQHRILISPYILTPSTLLAFNGLALKECDTLIKSILNSKFNLFINNTIHKCEGILDMKYKQNVFQYQSEQDIVREGSRQRSMDERNEQLHRRIEILKKRVQKSSDIMVELILGVMAIFGLAEILSKDTDSRTLIIIMTIAGLFIFYEIARWYKMRK